jgi:PAS domain S-box-containing protein
MIATLSPTGQFLYANPAWRQCFGLERTAMLALHSFEELFSNSTGAEVAALFRRALEGELVEGAPLRHYTSEGRALDLELSLSRRQKAGHALAVRCLLRDVTQQKQRENRLALQLAVSQIVGENAPGESAGMRILEALCISQGWELGIEWLVNTEQMCLEFGTAWGVPGQRAEELIERSTGLTLAMGSELPERAWKEGRPVWLADLAAAPTSPRVAEALEHEFQGGQCRYAPPTRCSQCWSFILVSICSRTARPSPQWKLRPHRWDKCSRGPRKAAVPTT